MTRCRQNIILFVLWITCTLRLEAQQLPFVHYTPENGLVNNRARQLYQDSKGRLYVSTYGGLSVYDGARFTNYTTDNGLITSLVNDIVEMGEDSVWVIPNGPMIHCLVHGQLKDFLTADHFYPVINQLIRGRNGVYYAIADEGLFRLEKNRFVKIPLRDPAGREVGRFLGRAAAMGDYLFLLTDQHLDKFPGPGILLAYNLVSGRLSIRRPSAPFNFITATPGNEIWLSSAAGEERLDLGALPDTLLLTRLPAFLQPPDHTTTNYIFFDHKGSPWFSTGNGVYTIAPGTKERTLFLPTNGLPSGINISIFQDREETMWFANEETGITKLSGTDVRLVQEPVPGFRTQLVYAHPGSDSVWFFDTRHNDLLLLDNDRPTRFRCISTLAQAPVTFIMTPVPYLITSHHIYRLTLLPGLRYTATSLCTDTLSYYGSSTEDSHGNLLVLSDKLTGILSGKITRQPIPAFVDQPVIDSAGNCWIITRTNQLLTARLTHSDTGTILPPLRRIDIGKLPTISPRSLTLDPAGRVWVGTRDHGLFCLTLDKDRLVDWKQWTVSDGLAGNFVTSLLCDKDGGIWVCTATGLDYIRYDNARFSVQNRTAGFHNYSYVFNIFGAGRDIHWAATRSGFLRIDGRQQNAEPVPAPAIVFSGILSGNRPINPGEPIRLSYRENNIHFYIAAPSFINETHTRYAYRLDGGANSDWSSPSPRGEINFDNLPPGKYRLTAKALFYGRYPDPEAHLDFLILPPWWQSNWARIAALFLFTVLILFIVKTYTRRKLAIQRIRLEKQQAVEKERTRIAMDMHDDLGAGLTRIKFITEDMAQYAAQDTLRTHLDKLRSSSNELVDKMGEIIWAMNEKNNTLEDLLFYLRAYAVDYCQDNGLDCEFLISPPIPARQVSGQVRRNIFLILKECLHNIVKHANARKATIKITADDHLRMQVKDDGRGFDPATPVAGNGLLNMQFRATEMRGTLRVLHQEATTIQLDIPL